MTEQEAQLRWCPYRAGKKSPLRQHPENCISADCMAWRWVMEHKLDADGIISGPHPSEHGYCVLLSKP